MPPSRSVLPILACALWACAPAATPDGALRVLAVCAPEALTDSLRAHPEATLVVVLGGDSDAAQAAVTAAGRDQRPFVVVVEDSAPLAAPLPDAWVEAPSGAEAAVDLALLARRGAAPAARRYEIGARTWTAANRAAGGERTVAPADPILALLRSQLGDPRATASQQREPVRVIFWTGDADGDREAAALAEARAAAARRPQLELVERAELAGTARSGAQAVLLATEDRARTQLAATEANLAADGALPVFALDPLLHDVPGASSIGCTPQTLARAAAARVQSLLPEGGALLVCSPAGADGVTAARRRALLAALGLERDALR